MSGYQERFTISRPTLKLLEKIGLEPADLFYGGSWKKLDNIYSINEYEFPAMSISRNTGLSSTSFEKRRSCIYSTFQLKETFFYREINQKLCELDIYQAIPQSTELALKNRRIRDVIGGLDFISDEKIVSARCVGNLTEFILSTRWLRLKRVPPVRDPNVRLFG